MSVIASAGAMAQVTIQLIEGLERGRIFDDLSTPVTVGREDENAIQLNDERVSRFHAKIQEDEGRLILTDLDSTNGTRVNGHPVQMRVLQPGDQLSIGRCLLIFGSPEEIASIASNTPSDRVVPAERGDRTIAGPMISDNLDSSTAQPGAFAGVGGADIGGQPGELFPNGPPGPPSGLRPVQRAEFSDFLAYAHEQIRTVLQSSSEERGSEAEKMQVMRVGWLAWQRLLKLQMDLSVYLRKLAEPDE